MNTQQTSAIKADSQFACNRHESVKLGIVYLFLIASLIFASIAFAENPPLNEDSLSYEPSLTWLSGDVDVSAFGNGDYDSFVSKSEIWTKNWGISTKLLHSDHDDLFGLPADSQYFNLDVKRRVLGTQNKSNVQLGLGWQELDIDSQLDASGQKFP